MRTADWECVLQFPAIRFMGDIVYANKLDDLSMNAMKSLDDNSKRYVSSRADFRRATLFSADVFEREAIRKPTRTGYHYRRSPLNGSRFESFFTTLAEVADDGTEPLRIATGIS